MYRHAQSVCIPYVVKTKANNANAFSTKAVTKCVVCYFQTVLFHGHICSHVDSYHDMWYYVPHGHLYWKNTSAGEV